MLAPPIDTSEHRAPFQLHELSDDVVVVALRGLGSAAVAAAAVDGMRARPLAHHVVADLSRLTIVEPAAVEVLVGGLHDLTGADRQFCVVSRRLSGRRLLRRFGPSGLPVFSSINDALQARVHHQLGFGAGWRTLGSPAGDGRRPAGRR
ncbi:MAG TPA: hypothetical protein VNT56_01700 [Acidimicrobiales bacterium]|nr:hypothetical protein [Acidimicrobiales bacterium]